MNREQEKAMFAKRPAFNSGLTKEQLLGLGDDRKDLYIEKIRKGEMVGTHGKIFAEPYDSRTAQSLADHIKKEKEENPNYDFIVPKSEPYEGYAWKASQFNFNNIRHQDMRKLLDKKATDIKVINRAKADADDKKLNPHRVWGISAQGMFERNKALRRWLSKEGYSHGINSVSFFSGGSNRNDDPKSDYHYKDYDSQKSTNIDNVNSIVYWRDDATPQQKQSVQAIFSKYFDYDLNHEFESGADFADADVSTTPEWRKKLQLDNYKWGALKVEHWG